jgi:hypothetical protein
MKSSNRQSTIEIRKSFVLVILLLASTLHADPHLLLDRPVDPIGMNLGWEFPGAGGKLETMNDPARGECRKMEYDFTQGGQYMYIEFPGPPALAKTIRFQFKNTQPGKAIFRIKDDTDQHFVGVFEYKPGTVAGNHYSTG